MRTFRAAGVRRIAIAGFCVAAAAGASAAALAGSGWVTAGVAGTSGALGAFIPGWVDMLREREARRAAMNRLRGSSPTHPVTRYLTATEAQAVVPFTGRARETAQLLEWCRARDRPIVWLVTGQGGVGKTRLAERVMHQLTSNRWLCVMVPPGDEAGAWDLARDSTKRRILLAVDYAESRHGLAALLRSVAAAPDPGRVRLLLLARGAGEWWERLGAQDAPVRALVEAAGTLALGTDLGTDLTDRQLVDQAVPYFAARVGVDFPLSGPVAVPTSQTPVPVLVLQAAALIAVLRELDRPAGDVNAETTVHGVLRSLLGHEAYYWNGSRPAVLAQASERVTRSAVALSCLYRPPDLDAAARLLTRVPELHDAGLGACREVAYWVRELYPPSGGGWWGSLAPGLAAEHLVCDVLEQDNGLITRFLSDSGTLDAANALALLDRAGSHHPAASGLLERALRADPALLSAAVGAALRPGGTLGAVLARVLEDAPPEREQLVALHEAIPYPTTALAAASLVVTRQIVDQLPSDARPAERSRWLASLGLSYSQAGLPAQALEPTRQAVDIRRQLNEANPDRYLGDLAAALDELGVRFSELGHPQDALAPTQEAVNAYRRLADTNPDRYNGDLAAALNNLGVRFSELGHPQDALAPTQEAVSAYHRLADTDPDRYSGDLARSLDNLGIWYSQLDRPADALPLTQQAVNIRTDLAKTNPDRYNGDLARSLINLGVRFVQLDRPADAVTPGSRAVELYRQIAETNPDRYLGEYLRALASLAEWSDAAQRTSVPGDASKLSG